MTKEYRQRAGVFALVLMAGLAAWLTAATPAQAVRPSIRDLLIVDRTTDVTFGDSRGGVVRYRYRPPIQINIGSLATGFVDPVAAVALTDRTLLVADASADPVGYGQSNGAIFRVDASASLADGVTELMAASPLFIDPADLLLEPDGRVLIVDSAADPNEFGGAPGAVFRLDPETGNLDIVAASPLFAQPRSISYDLDGSVLICDIDADPLARGSADGAIFRLNPLTGAVTLFRAFGGTGLSSPASVGRLAGRGLPGRRPRCHSGESTGFARGHLPLHERRGRTRSVCVRSGLPRTV